MLLSYKWLREFVDFNQTPEELANILTMLGFEVEEIKDYSKKYNGFYIGYVVDKIKHPDADKLSICTVRTGDEVSQVVCGAPNVAAGQKIILGKSGAIVPAAGFKLEKRKIRGVESNGMICSQAELDLGDDSSGIWVLPDEATDGTPITEYFGLNDSIIDISVTPNRADALSHLGIAREIAAFNNTKLKLPPISFNSNSENIKDILKINIENQIGCPRYIAKVVRNVKIAESPDWLKNRLTLLGLRPRNNVVDITNFIMFELGQPLHAFDYDCIEGNEIIVKNANNGESFTTLDSKQRTLDSEMLMICDANKPLAIAGVMGGENSEITDGTTNVLIESAFFEPSIIRKTAKKLSIHSDASYRFERGVDPEISLLAVERAAQLLAMFANGEVVNGMIDSNSIEKEIAPIIFKFNNANKLIGNEIPSNLQTQYLTNLGFEVNTIDEESISVVKPSWRFDVSQEADLIEEIARTFGYDNINSSLSSNVDFSKLDVPNKLKQPKLRKSIINYLISRGFNETITKNIVDGDSASLSSVPIVSLTNPISEEYNVMRNSMIPSMMNVISHNKRLGNHNLQLFEIGKIFQIDDKNHSSFVDGYLETEQLVIALTGNVTEKQWGLADRECDFYDIKGLFDDIAAKYLITNFSYQQANLDLFSKNSLEVKSKNSVVAYFGEISRKALKHFDIESNTFVLVINIQEFNKLIPKDVNYKKLSSYPTVNRDLAFLVNKSQLAGDIQSKIYSLGSELLKDVSIFDVYTGKNIEQDSKSLAFALTFGSNERTLTDNDIEPIIDSIIQNVESNFNAKLRTN